MIKKYVKIEAAEKLVNVEATVTQDGVQIFKGGRFYLIGLEDGKARGYAAFANTDIATLVNAVTESISQIISDMPESDRELLLHQLTLDKLMSDLKEKFGDDSK